MAEQRLRALTPRQDDKLGEIVRRLEAGEGREEERPENAWFPILALPKLGTQVYHTYVGNCNLVRGSGLRNQEIIRDQVIVDNGGAKGFEFLTRDTSSEIKFVNLTGVILTQDDYIVLMRVVVPETGSYRAEGDTYNHEGGMWAAINSVNQIHYGRTTGIVAAGGVGKALPLTEVADDDGLGNVNVSLFWAHGDEDISSSQEIIYTRRQADRLVIGAECEAESTPISTSPGYSSPTPDDEETVVSTTVTLGWVGGGGADDLFFGQPGQILQIAQNLTVNSFSFSAALPEDTVFEWFVRSFDGTTGATILSPLWSFTTGPNSIFAMQMTGTGTVGAALTGGAVQFAVDWSASATMTAGLGGGRVDFASDSWTAPAVMTADIRKF